MADRRIFIATETFTTSLRDGRPVFVRKDVTRVRVGHELLKGREQFFAPLFVQFDTDTDGNPVETR